MTGERNGAGEPAPVICAAISRVPARIRRDGPPPGRGSAHDKHHACASGRVSPLTQPWGRPGVRALTRPRDQPRAAGSGSPGCGSAPSGRKRRPWVRFGSERPEAAAPGSAPGGRGGMFHPERREGPPGRPRAPAGPSRGARRTPDRRGVIGDRRSAAGPPWGGRPPTAAQPPGGYGKRGSPRRYLSGRTTPRIFIEPAPARVTLRPGRGAWTIAPSPTYIPTWLASAW